MASKLRRLASDHANLHNDGLPPNFLFHPSSLDCADLTNLSVYLAGPDNTPYSHGVFHLELRMESSYPQAPPTAYFRTKIFHPNVDSTSGAVCVDTLKRDWKPELTLRDVLVTISCLLVCPNPASALNAEAGHLMEDDFTEFEERAAMWSRIHACIPSDLKLSVEEAKSRIIGEITAKGPEKGKKRRGPVIDPSSPFMSQNELPDIENTPSIRHPAAPKKGNNQSGTENMSNEYTPSAPTIGLGLNNITSSITTMDIDTPTQPQKRQSRKRYAMLPPTTKGNSPQLGQYPLLSPALTSTPLLSLSPQSSFPTTPSPAGETDPETPAHISVSPDRRPMKRRRTCSQSPPAASSLPLQSITSLPRYENHLNVTHKRDPSNDPFSTSFTMPWLDWENFLSPKAKTKADSTDLNATKREKTDEGPRRGLFRF